MISKSLKAHSFYHTSRYVLQKKGAEVLLAEGVRGYDFKLMAEDFLTQQQMRPGKEMAGAHFILSFHPKEKPSDELMKSLAQEYLTRLGVVNTQFAIIKHTDKDHLHMHIIANLVNNEGKAISDSWIGLRGKKIAQQLTREHNLIPAIEKNLQSQHVEAFNTAEAIKYEIYEAIAQSLLQCRTMQDLENSLLSKGIQTLYKYKGKTSEVQGISFSKGDYCFKGSEIDRKFSYPNLQKAFEKQQKQPQTAQIKPSPIPTFPPISPRQKKTVTPSAFVTRTGGQGQSSGNALGKLVEEFLKPVEAPGGSSPYELSQEEELRRKKRKKRPPL
jgi:hypothetical protein